MIWDVDAPMTTLWGDLLHELIGDSGDPDDVIPKWVSSATPLGIKREIESRGVFPANSERRAPATSLQDAEEQAAWTPATDYKSYDENRGLAERELEKEIEKGFLTWSEEEATLAAKVGELISSKIGTIVKEKNGKIKVRLIHDLKRSLVNSMTTVPERVVLPRLLDAVHGIIHIAAEAA